jgi:hypothetical protein
MFRRIEARLAPLSGLVFIALIGVGRIIGSEYPDADADTASVLDFWTDNDSEQMIIAAAGSLGTIFFIWFAATLRNLIWRAEGGAGRLASITFAGALLTAGAILADEWLVFTAADTAGDVPEGMTQTVSALQSDFFLPLVAGFALFHIGAGLGIIYTRALPAWAGWTSLITGLLWITPLFFGIFLTVIWIVAVSILMFVRGGVPVEDVPAEVAVPEAV